MILPSKSLAKELAADSGKVLSFAQRVMRLVESDKRNSALIDKNSAAISGLTEELEALRIEVRELRLRAEISAAQAELTAAKIAMTALSDLSRRVGVLEGASQLPPRP